MSKNYPHDHGSHQRDHEKHLRWIHTTIPKREIAAIGSGIAAACATVPVIGLVVGGLVLGLGLFFGIKKRK